MLEDFMFTESPSFDIKKTKAKTDGFETIVDNDKNKIGETKSNYSSEAPEENRRNLLEPLHKNKCDNGQDTGAGRYLLLRLLHSVLSGFNYGLALLLMLIAMTYNPSLLIALIVGYIIGDFIFFARMRPQSSSVDCH
jgi:hypothetical protein